MVSALVYVSAFAPDVGQSLATLAKNGPATEGVAAIHPDAKGNLYIDPKVFPSAVAADLPPKLAESLANHQLPLNVKAFEAPVDTAAWRDKPTFYVITTKDKVIAPEAQKFFATRMKAQMTDVAGSHASSSFTRRSRGGDREGRARGVTLLLPALSRRERARSPRGSRTYRTGNCANPTKTTEAAETSLKKVSSLHHSEFPHSNNSCPASGG